MLQDFSENMVHHMKTGRYICHHHKSDDVHYIDRVFKQLKKSCPMMLTRLIKNDFEIINSDYSRSVLRIVKHINLAELPSVRVNSRHIRQVALNVFKGDSLKDMYVTSLWIRLISLIVESDIDVPELMFKHKFTPMMADPFLSMCNKIHEVYLDVKPKDEVVLKLLSFSRGKKNAQIISSTI